MRERVFPLQCITSCNAVMLVHHCKDNSTFSESINYKTTFSEESLYENVTCGSFLGDKRYCLDLSNTDLAEPPVGWNITTILYVI